MNIIITLCVFAVIIFIVFLLGLRNEKNEERTFKNTIISEYSKAPADRLKSNRRGLLGYFNKHKKDYYVDDITWNDLSMDDIFDRINYCESSSGEEYLYYLIRNPKISSKSLSELEDFERKVKAFEENEDLRLTYKRLFNKIGKNLKYSIYEYLEFLDKCQAKSNAGHFAALVIMVAAILSMIFVNFNIGFLVFILIIAFNVVSYFKEKAKIDPYLATFSYVCRLEKNALVIADESSEFFSLEKESLKKSSGNLNKFVKGSWILMSPSRMSGSGNPIDILMDYVRMVTHADLIKFNSMIDALKENIGSVDELITVMGSIDAALSIAYFRASLQNGYCKPDLTDNDDKFSVSGAYHPLIEAPVPNNIETKRGVLITGSNASGKSTFLKTIAINAIFAQSIYTSLSESYRSHMYRIYSSMALRDDLNYGDSYYMVEIKSLKRILDAGDEKDNAPVLCFIDEVLRGTNTTERIAASAKVLEHFASSDVCCFAATHDLELSKVLDKNYDIYHFEGVMENDDVVFDYKIKEGGAGARNAIKLLKTIGYDESIVEEAEKMAVKFDETGEWTL
ncbi:MAG: hypothetical protein K6G06_01975 [Butyrivibrio sp.]|nr:hypothetical protein [Butyrivibrio sp.]